MTVDEVRTRMLDYLPDLYLKEAGSVNYGVMTGYATEINFLYGALGLLHDEIYLNTATGEFLDDLALIFKLTRKVGETDTEFRGRIKAFWTVFSGGGTVQAIKDAIQALTTVLIPQVVIDEFEPLKFRVTFPAPSLSAVIIESVIDATYQAKAAGVYPFFTATDTLANETITVAESLSFSDPGGIIVSSYEVSSGSEV